MALANYSELKTAITSFTNRSDLTAQHDTFIVMAEDAIYNGIGSVSPLRISAMQTSVSTGLPNLPSDFLEAIRLAQNVGSVTKVLDYRTPDHFAKYPSSGGTGRYFTRLGQQILTVPDISGGSYTLHYYKRFSTLDGTNTTNYILTNAPTVYLYGCLMALYKMTYDAAKEEKTMRDFAAAMSAFQSKENNSMHAGSRMETVVE